ncbi:hypothetical protein LC087_18500 [Bacillus carboniphilus]|uniref:Uncharacterized protein n=1 Tax=Bacillus carboniphilus TaxID=86663 RepID=A0ABY9JTC8_9BACI|nr:hypothetical protein [Bacillus carboniphilus]WLR42641.1 hypothetical protein LC087_18500 [Bacillus carboniphilus]
MKNKKWIISIGLLLIISIILFVFIYRFYFAKPSTFPSDEQLLKVLEMDNHFSKANASNILDVIDIDQSHKFVPFTTKQNEYGTSYWEYEKNQWQIKHIEFGQPHVWTINMEDPSTFYISWNIHPDDQVKDFQLYFMRDRDYDSSDGMSTYYPKVQMEKTITLDKSYGIMKLPNEWISIMKKSKKVDTNFSMSGFFSFSGFTIKSIFLDKNNQQVEILSGSYNNVTYTTEGFESLHWVYNMANGLEHEGIELQ